MLSYVFNCKLLAAFVAEYGLMLCTVIFKGAPYVLHKRYRKDITDEDEYLDHSLNGASEYAEATLYEPLDTLWNIAISGDFEKCKF